MLLAVINGNINRNAYFDPPPILGLILPNRGMTPSGTEVTGVAYEAYLQAEVIEPSGVVGATLDHPPACALAYRGPDDTEPGWNSGPPAESWTGKRRLFTAHPQGGRLWLSKGSATRFATQSY